MISNFQPTTQCDIDTEALFTNFPDLGATEELLVDNIDFPECTGSDNAVSCISSYEALNPNYESQCNNVGSAAMFVEFDFAFTCKHTPLKGTRSPSPTVMGFALLRAAMRPLSRRSSSISLTKKLAVSRRKASTVLLRVLSTATTVVLFQRIRQLLSS